MNTNKTVNILGIALIYTITSTFVAIIPNKEIITNSFFTASGKVNAGISTLKATDIISVDTSCFDVDNWLKTGNTNIYINNLRDEGKAIVVYFDIEGSIKELVENINPIALNPGESRELHLEIRDLDFFKLSDNIYSGIIKIRALNDYINKLSIDIPEFSGIDVLMAREDEKDAAAKRVIGIENVETKNETTDISIKQKINEIKRHGINCVEDIFLFVCRFDELQKEYDELENKYAKLSIDYQNLSVDSEEERQRLMCEIEDLQKQFAELQDRVNAMNAVMQIPLQSTEIIQGQVNQPVVENPEQQYIPEQPVVVDEIVVQPIVSDPPVQEPIIETPVVDDGLGDLQDPIQEEVKDPIEPLPVDLPPELPPQEIAPPVEELIDDDSPTEDDSTDNEIDIGASLSQKIRLVALKLDSIKNSIKK